MPSKESPGSYRAENAFCNTIKTKIKNSVLWVEGGTLWGFGTAEITSKGGLGKDILDLRGLFVTTEY